MLLYPLGNHAEIYEIVPKRNGRFIWGNYGTIVYLYTSDFEYDGEAGKLYHPVNTPEEAQDWLGYYREKMLTAYGVSRKYYSKVYFVPNVEALL